LFGAGAAASVLWPVSDAAAIRAAASSAGLNGLAGSGTGAGSVTAGGSGGTGGGPPRPRPPARGGPQGAAPPRRGGPRWGPPGGGPAGGGRSAADGAVGAVGGHVQRVRAAARARRPAELRAAAHAARVHDSARARARVPADRPATAGRRPQFGGHLGITQPRR